MSLRKPKPVPTASKRILHCSRLRSSSTLGWYAQLTEGGTTRLMHGFPNQTQFCTSFIALCWQNGSFEFLHVCVMIFHMLVYLYQHSRLHTQKQLQYIISEKKETKYRWTINVTVSLLTFSMNNSLRTDLHPLCTAYLNTTVQNKLFLHPQHSVTIIRKVFISQLEWKEIAKYHSKFLMLNAFAQMQRENNRDFFRKFWNPWCSLIAVQQKWTIFC